MSLVLEQVVVGGYRIERKLGSGGQGQVYLGWREGREPQPAVLDPAGTSARVGRNTHLWQPEPIAPGKRGRVVVEALATKEQALGTYTLTLWDAERQRTVVLGEVTFP